MLGVAEAVLEYVAPKVVVLVIRAVVITGA